MKKVLATVAQWERHALKNCNWRGELPGLRQLAESFLCGVEHLSPEHLALLRADAKPAQTNLHLGVGWWELPELENYPAPVPEFRVCSEPC